ncbi:hypothetical protein HNQ59_003897 [Chitinivorax tropicus]|uniref:Uncharacterized protein n=1 Tax=Chitinivorax tropicus TaxID=714531 RepID=A0A840MW78_9PROT|nr:hypothetical protein [Chitinivorax tropicus]MBB5020576.1 hypothetical protein [Chitinivorax tropicus]
MSYCKVYVDTVYSMHDLKLFMEENIENCFEGLKCFVSLDFAAYDNENNNGNLAVGMKEDPTEARYYIEIGDDFESEFDSYDFKYGLANFIISLRRKFEYVVASCNFEDYIVERTGWNWTDDCKFPD